VEIELVVQSAQDGAVQNVRCVLERMLVIGRDPESPVRLQGTGISREHLSLQEDGGQLFLNDLSSNGTWLNGAKVEKGQPREIREGDVVEIPGYHIDVRVTAAPPPAAVPAPPTLTEVSSAREVPEASQKPSFLRPFTSAISALSLLEKLLIIASMASFWLGIYYYMG